MSELLKNLPGPLKPEGDWANIFSYHAMDIEVARTEGIYYYDTEGRKYLDASGGPMAFNLPHGHPKMLQAIKDQLEAFTHIHPVLANRPRADLCNRLAQVAPASLNTSYLVSGGSEAVETAMKAARQYHFATGNIEKFKVISHYQSYHGMTLATQGLSGNPAYERFYGPMLPRSPHIPQYSDFDKPDHLSRAEWGKKCAEELEKIIYLEGPHTVSAFIATPHGCGTDYGVVAPIEYWQEIRRICDHYDVLLIADEVVTGFGRTGKWFAMEHFGIEADIMTTAKGISSCYMPLGAVTVSDKINAPFLEDAYFVHGFTNGGHPLACAAGVASIDIIESEGLIDNVNKVGKHLFDQKNRFLEHPTVADARGWGLFMVLELVKNKETMDYFDQDQQAEQLFQSLALKNGLVFYGTLYGARRQPIFRRGLPMWIAPPFSITEVEMDDLITRLDQTLSEWEDQLGVV